MDIKLETTNDGSHTFFVANLNEHYHSTNGAIEEAQHVFIHTGLNQCTKKKIKVFEIGFGTGLNTFLTFLEAEKRQLTIDYTSIELYPVAISLARQLNFAQLTAPDQEHVFHKLHDSPWGECVEITSSFSLMKIECDLTSDMLPDTLSEYDVIYFDAFGPDKQPEMWSRDIFEKMYNICSENGVLVTYSAKGSIRRLLQSIGFTVERLPGPPGKREMLRATKKENRQ